MTSNRRSSGDARKCGRRAEAGGLNLAGLSRLGVKRVSVGSALSRAALGAFLRAAREIRDAARSHSLRTP